ncbi:N-carbamoylsarcosine amidase, part A [Serratia marcescens SMB2099]|nr:hypothetical protein [Serratia marcescens]CDJ76853.1 N-carbamoylsarcosine amidase, part A [Serratia marcescens SMB2099]
MNDTLSDNYRGVWGQRIGFGRRPALLAIDFMQAYTTEGAPLFAPGVVSAVEESRELLACARRTGIPVIPHPYPLSCRPFCRWRFVGQKSAGDEGHGGGQPAGGVLPGGSAAGR